MTNERRTEELKDARDYRTSLIQKRNDLDAKLSRTEERIQKLKAES